MIMLFNDISLQRLFSLMVLNAKQSSLVPRLSPAFCHILYKKTGREPGRFHHMHDMRGFMRGFGNRIIATHSLTIVSTVQSC